MNIQNFVIESLMMVIDAPKHKLYMIKNDRVIIRYLNNKLSTYNIKSGDYLEIINYNDFLCRVVMVTGEARGVNLMIHPNDILEVDCG